MMEQCGWWSCGGGWSDDGVVVIIGHVANSILGNKGS